MCEARRAWKVPARLPPLAGRQAKVLQETHPAAVAGKTLAADFSPFAVHLYELDKRQPLFRPFHATLPPGLKVALWAL